MKTSLTDGLQEIACGKNPRDVIFNIPSAYEIINNGIAISETTLNKHLDLVAFRGEDIFDSVFSNPNIAKIVVSSSLKKQYEGKIVSIKSKIDFIKDSISLNVLESKKSNKNNKIDELLGQYGGRNDLERISNLLEKSHNVIKEDVSSLSFSSIFNEKTEPILNDPTFLKRAEEYQKLKNVKLNEKIFNNGFSIQELQNVHDASQKNKFYSAGHQLSINNMLLDKEGVEKLITDSVKSAYGSDEMKLAFQSAKTILEKNENSRKIIKALTENPWLLEKLSEPPKFQDDLIFKKMEGCMEEILIAKQEIENAKKDIEKIFEDAKKTESVWKKVIETYNRRFINKYFDIGIKNQIDAIIGLQEPVFVKILKGSGNEITEEIFQRFSSGEKRAIFILYFLFEIEISKSPGVNTTIIADDIVDSFDFKNKYAMIEYLCELSCDPDVQLLLLTHNFDFFRSCLHSFGENIDSKLFGYLGSNDEVSLFEAKSNIYESFHLFNEWKNKDDTKSLISLIPFLRNLVELKKGNSSSEYETLCHFLHFDINTINLNLQNLSNIYDDHGISHTSATTMPYWALLVNEVKQINSPVVESNIQEKVILGLFIRLSSDFFLLKKYRTNNNGIDPVIPPHSNWTKKLKKMAYSYLGNDEKKLYDKAIIVAPSFIHVNSFMYEPLIDVGSEKLLAISQELLGANGL